MNVPPVWFPVTYIKAGSSGDASGGERDIYSAEPHGGAHGFGPCRSVGLYMALALDILTAGALNISVQRPGHSLRGGAMVACRSHKPKVVGSNPTPANPACTAEQNTATCQAVNTAGIYEIGSGYDELLLRNAG